MDFQKIQKTKKQKTKKTNRIWKRFLQSHE